jgi:N-acetylglutamate synthase-like GNAT family acetyltransferase
MLKNGRIANVPRWGHDGVVVTDLELAKHKARPEPGVITTPMYPVTIEVARKPDIIQIMNLINCENLRSGAVLKVDFMDVRDWVEKKLSLLAKLDDEVIAHQSASELRQDGWIELRAAVVKREYRDRGINDVLLRLQIEYLLERNPEATLCALKNGSSGGVGSLLSAGFREIPAESAPKELFEIGGDQRWAIYVLTAEDYMRKNGLLESVRTVEA